MKLIDSTYLILSADIENNKIHVKDIIHAPEIDPIHAANACYCKECWYYTEWGECKEFGDIMKPDEFCSRGVLKNGKTY